MNAQIPSIFDPNSRFFYDDLLEMCVGSHSREDVNRAISASIAYITTKSGMWIRKKEAENGSIYFEFAPDLKGISPMHKIKIQSSSGDDDDENMTTMSVKLKGLLQQASIKRIRYVDVNFRPYPPNAPRISNKFFNLFLGFKAQPTTEIDKGLIYPILRHIKEVWCDDNKELLTYVLNWLAFLVQKPDEKPGTALLLRSPPRCGKNIITDFIGEQVLGRENFFCTTRLHDVMGKFNGAIRAKKLIVLNECDMTGSEWHGANNQLKGLITEPYISIEEKGIDIKVINDFAGYMILSNHAMPIRIELGDERYVALDVSARYKGNREYFRSLLKLTKDPKTASSFMAYLLSRNIADGWSPRDIPNTKMKQELIEASMPNPQRFMLEYIDNYWSEHDEDNIREISCSKFYKIYQNWCQDTGEAKILSSNKFGMEIKQFVVKTRPRSEGRIPHYKLDRKVIMGKFNESLSDIPSPSINVIEEVETEKNEEPKPESPKDAPKKISPPVPPKPDHLKIKVKSSNPTTPKDSEMISLDGLMNELSGYIKELEEPDPASIPLPESDDEPEPESVESEPIPEPKPESAELIPEPEVVESAPKPYGIPGPSKTSAQKPEYDPEADELKYKPWLKNSKEDMVNELYTSAEKYWVKLEIGDPEDFDWTQLIEEIRDREVHKCLKPVSNKWEALLDSFVQRFKSWVEYNEELERYISNEDIADFLERYQKKKEIEFVSPPEGFKTVKLKKIPCNSQRECVLAKGEEEWSDAEDEWYDQLEKA